MKYHRNLLFNAMHQDWYICEESNWKERDPAMVLDFYKGEPDVLQRCSFAVYPLSLNSNKYMNCRNVLGPVKHREINGQSLPHPPPLLPHLPPPPPLLPVCLPVCPAQEAGGTSGVGGTSAQNFLSTVGVSSVQESARTSLFLCSVKYGLTLMCHCCQSWAARHFLLDWGLPPPERLSAIGFSYP